MYLKIAVGISDISEKVLLNTHCGSNGFWGVGFWCIAIICCPVTFQILTLQGRYQLDEIEDTTIIVSWKVTENL